VYFPLADAGSAIGDRATPAVSRLAATETVLVVEHTDALRSVTSRLLTLQGYRVLGAANARQALELFSDNVAIDVVLTDVVLPRSSGPEMIRILLDRRPSLKVVYMTGCADDAIVQHGVLLPGIALLRKPFTAETLGRRIRAALEAPSLAVG
jgi:DNA-binding NtrC family response regulator